MDFALIALPQNLRRSATKGGEIMYRSIATSLLALMGFTCAPAYAATVHTADFINDLTRSNFIDLESLPSTGAYGATYSESGISVEQVNGDLNGIWTSLPVSSPWNGSFRSWYPSGGDNGYSKLSLISGGDFDNIGFQYRHNTSGPTIQLLYYELYDNGNVIQSGNFSVSYGIPGYLGFSGGGFDEVHVWSWDNWTSMNALELDNIEIASVPEAETYAMMLVGIGLVGWAARRRKQIH